MKLGWMGLACVLSGCASAPKLQANNAAGAVAPETTAAHSTHSTLATAIEEDEKKGEGPLELPTTCDSETTFGSAKTKLCLPTNAWTKKMCASSYPEVALSMFGKATPWTRVYLAGDVDAWNASGGLTHRTQLMFDEEVIVLSKHAPAGSGGIVMTGMQASVDVLRWDGSCVSVMEGEITAKKPPQPKPSAIPFSRLDEGTRHTLLEAPKVKKLYADLGKACGGEKAACDKADKAFAAAIAVVVGAGASLPAPGRRP